MQQKGKKMKTTQNPFKKGGPCYLAWEAGYVAALDDVSKLNECEHEEHTDQEGSEQDG